MSPQDQSPPAAHFDELMHRAIDVCRQGIAAGESPFGAAIAKSDGTLICVAHNSVRATCDSTAHAEINAIRLACTQLQRIDLSGHVLATTCEPCPMCAAAIHWAKLDAVIYGAAIADAAHAGFSEIDLPCATLYTMGRSPVKIFADVRTELCRQLFQAWKSGPNPITY